MFNYFYSHTFTQKCTNILETLVLHNFASLEPVFNFEGNVFTNTILYYRGRIPLPSSVIYSICQVWSNRYTYNLTTKSVVFKIRLGLRKQQPRRYLKQKRVCFQIFRKRIKNRSCFISYFPPLFFWSSIG